VQHNKRAAMARLFLLPFLLALGWTLWLVYFRIPLYQGRKGFYWIIGVSGVLVAFFSLMLFITH
jgi:hypothetical protein